MNALVLKARHLGNFEADLVHTYVNQRLYFKAVTVNFHVVKAVFPAGVVAITQIAEMCPEKHIYQRTQPLVTHAA